MKQSAELWALTWSWCFIHSVWRQCCLICSHAAAACQDAGLKSWPRHCPENLCRTWFCYFSFEEFCSNHFTSEPNGSSRITSDPPSAYAHWSTETQGCSLSCVCLGRKGCATAWYRTEHPSPGGCTSPYVARLLAPSPCWSHSCFVWLGTFYCFICAKRKQTHGWWQQTEQQRPDLNLVLFEMHVCNLQKFSRCLRLPYK